MTDDDTHCQLHVHMSSVDRPGILAEALESIVQLNWDVLDIKQFVFNGLLNLSLLLGGNVPTSITILKKSLESWASKNNISLRVLPWESMLKRETPYKYRSVVTL